VLLVGSTLVTIALFTPLRRWIVTFADWRLYRRKYDTAKTPAAFSATLRQEAELSTLSEDLLAVVSGDDAARPCLPVAAAASAGYDVGAACR